MRTIWRKSSASSLNPATWSFVLARATLPNGRPVLPTRSVRSEACLHDRWRSHSSGAPGQHRGKRQSGRLHLVPHGRRSEEHTSELQSLMRISYAVFCLKKKKKYKNIKKNNLLSHIHNTNI